MKSANNINVHVDRSGHYDWITATAPLPFGGDLELTWIADATIAVYINKWPVSTLPQPVLRFPKFFRLTRIKHRLAVAAQQELESIESNAQLCCDLLERADHSLTCEVLNA